MDISKKLNLRQKFPPGDEKYNSKDELSLVKPNLRFRKSEIWDNEDNLGIEK